MTDSSAAAPAPAPAASAATHPKRYYASIHPGIGTEVDQNFASLVLQLEKELGIPIWLLVQDGNPVENYGDIDHFAARGFRDVCHEIEPGKPVALLIESPGGDAHYAYRIARFFQRRASEFIVIVPRWAKSAATIMALGASELIMGKDAELGPLDVQLYDPEREEFDSALNAVQSLERLNAFSMAAIDQVMPLLLRRTGRKMDTLLPLVLNYVEKFVEPLVQKIDAVDYTKKSRELKVAEQYAIRLMKSKYSWTRATAVAGFLVERFPSHGFAIDRDEAAADEKTVTGDRFGLGLNIKLPTPAVEEILGQLACSLDGQIAIGRLKEMPT